MESLELKRRFNESNTHCTYRGVEERGEERREQEGDTSGDERGEEGMGG